MTFDVYNIKYENVLLVNTPVLFTSHVSLCKKYSDGSRKDTVQRKFVGGFMRLLKRGNGESTFYFCNCNIFIPSKKKRKRILDLVDSGNFQVTPIRGVRFCV